MLGLVFLWIQYYCTHQMQPVQETVMLKTSTIAAVFGAALASMAAGKVWAGGADNPQLRFTCKEVQVDLPSGFGAGAWRLSDVTVKYPAMSMAQFTHLAKSRVGAKCQGHRPSRGGYRVGTFHFAVHGAVKAKLTMSGCSPDGRRVYINVSLGLPSADRVKLGGRDVSVRGRCG